MGPITARRYGSIVGSLTSRGPAVLTRVNAVRGASHPPCLPAHNPEIWPA